MESSSKLEGSDPNTNPFVMQPTKERIPMFIACVIIAILKLPLFLLIFTLSFIYSLFTVFIPIRPIQHAAVRIFSSIFFKILLLLTGIFSVNEQPTPLVDTYAETQEANQPTAGDIIISNCASYLNIFWLHEKYAPIFAIPIDPEYVVIKSVYHLFGQILTGEPLSKGKTIKLCDLVAKAKNNLKRVIVIFPEAAVTNGKSVLAFKEFGSGCDLSETHFHIYGFIHFGSYIDPNFTCGNGIYHFFMMIGRIFGGMKVKIALPQDIPRVENGIDDKWLKRCRYIMTTIMGVPCSPYNSSDFLTYSNSIKKKRSKKHDD